MFVDQATIKVIAGRGGDGASSFRTEKFVSRGGPDGGDGGDGGAVIARADNNVNTLSKFRHDRLIKAEPGERGKKRRAHGKNGEDTEIVVPPGTVIYEGEDMLADLAEVGQSAVLAKGGRGGFGNAHFVTSVRQAPKMAEIGEPGQERELRLELKSVADIGLVGMPNAGKSTLLSVVSNARPEIADYPFTTLVPNLGVAKIFDDHVVVADIPGLIEGASDGKGLGDDFLRHIERTKVLLHLIDAGADDVVESYRIINQELKSYSSALAAKTQVVALTKADAIPDEIVQEHRKQLAAAIGADVYVISSVAHQGLKETLGMALQAVKDANAKEDIDSQVEEGDDMPTLTLKDDPRAWEVEQTDSGFVVRGEQIEGFARRSDTSSSEAMTRLRDIMKKRGIARELVRLGIKPGDRVEIAEKKITW